MIHEEHIAILRFYLHNLHLQFQHLVITECSGTKSNQEHIVILRLHLHLQFQHIITKKCSGIKSYQNHLANFHLCLRLQLHLFLSLEPQRHHPHLLLHKRSLKALSISTSKTRSVLVSDSGTLKPTPSS
jgi:hypothetical protein